MNKRFVAFILLFIAVAFCGARAEPYLSVGAGYKLSEKLYVKCEWANPVASRCYGVKSHPLTARLEVGYEFKNVRVGMTHHSQWLQGKPFDNKKDEYSKNEIFVDYVLRWK